MEAILFNFTHYVKEEALDREVEILMFEEHTGHEAQILAIYVFESTVYLKERDLIAVFVFAPVDLHAGWVPYFTFLGMSEKFLFLGKERKTEVAYVKALNVVFLW